MSRDTAFPARLNVRPAMTQISLRIRAVWSEYSQGTVDSQGSRKDSEASADKRAILSLRFEHMHTAYEESQ